MLDVRLATLQLPLPLELALRRALMQRERAAQHEGLVLAWELAVRILAASLWSVARHAGAASPALETIAAKLERPSLGHWVELARTSAALLRETPHPAAAAFEPTLAGLEQPLPAECGLCALAQRVALLDGAPPRPRRVREALDLVPAYRNAAQSTHREVGADFRADSVPALLEGLIDFCERVPLLGRFTLVLAGRLERTPRGGTAELARLCGTSLSWQTRELPESAWNALLTSRPYLFREPDLVVPLFPLAAAATSGGDWHVGWYARAVHVPTVAYQGAGGHEFQLALAPDELALFSGAGVRVADDAQLAAALQLEPFRGLLAYEEDHAAIFFGREEETESALARLEQRGALLVYGASGSGKSSWLRAGVVPALRAKAALSGRRCLPIVLFPGDRPLASLRRALTWARGGTPEEAAAWARAVDEALPPDPARTHERGLAQLLRGLAAGGALPVLLVDQLEEAALLAVDRDETRAFLALIASAACSAQDLGAVVLASARADLLAPLIEHAPLRAALHEHGWPIGSIAPERLVRVITEPLRGRRTPIEPGLAETILADVAHEPGSLALVSQVLTTLWSERGRFGGALTKQGYVDAGRVSGALETQAEAALGEARAAATGGASPLHDGRATDARAVERRVDRLFRGLAQTDEGERFTRRRVPLAALASELGTSAEALRALAQPFVARRLVVFAGEAHKETVEVSHERLLDAWTRLRALLASERESLELRREVEHAAAAWEAGGRRSELWSDATSKLRRAEELAAAERLDLAERERAFLRASRAGVRGQKRLERGALAALGVLLLAAAGALGLATRQSRRADGEALNARHAAAAAEASARDARRQEQLATQKANDVLSLSAQKDLDDLVAEAATLWPAHPEMVPRYASWLARANELIEGRPEAPGQKRRPSLAEHEAQLADLRRGARPRSAEEVALPGAAVHERLTFEYDDPEQAWWDRSLSNLVGDLEQLQDPQTGLIHAVLAEPFGWGVTRRYAFAQTIGARSVDGPHAQRLWAAAIESIRTSPRYGGLAIEPQMGLVPIGMDLGSQLWEFAHLQTGEPAVRGADGRLVLTEETGLVFVLIPGGTLWMGAQKSDPHGRNHDPQAGDNEGPVHAVELSPYFLSKYEMTQGQWQRIAATNPSFYQPPGGLAPSLLHPVEQVAWPMCQEVLERLGLSLPSEAQWEYGARGGTTTVWWTGQERESLRGQVNLADQTALQAGATWPDISEWPDLEDGSVVHAAAGRYAANGYGLHEVTGNVFEWCLDGYDPGFYARQLGQDPVSPWPGSAGRVARGGGFNNGASSARAAFRLVSSPEYRDDDLGLRPARALSMARPPLHAPK